MTGRFEQAARHRRAGLMAPAQSRVGEVLQSSAVLGGSCGLRLARPTAFAILGRLLLARQLAGQRSYDPLVTAGAPEPDMREAASEARQEMYDALRLFHTHVQQTTALLLGIITTVFVVFGFALDRNKENQALSVEVVHLGGAILVLIAPLALLSVSIIGRYYLLYVSSLYFAATISRLAQLPAHPWFDDVPEEPSKKDPWIRSRTFGRGHSLFLYSLMLWLLGASGLISGIFVFLSF